MNLNFILLILNFYFIHCKIIQFEPNGYNKLIHPITLFFAKRGFLSVKICIANSSNQTSMEFASEIISEIKNLKITIKTLNASNTVEDKSPMILILGSNENFEEINSEVIQSDYSKYYLIISLQETFKNLQEISRTFWESSKLDVNFIVGINKKPLIFTFFPFKDGKCSKHLKLEKINEFNITWNNLNFFPDKIKNLNKCLITTGISLANPFAMISTDNIKNEKKFEGIDIDIIKTLSEEFNFSTSFHGPFSNIGVIYSNGSSTGLMSLLHQRKIDLMIGEFSLQLERLKFLSGTVFYMTDALILTMPPTSTISPFQKLYMPFDAIIWSLIITIYVISVVIFTFVRRMSETVYELIVGQNVKHPILNMLIAIVGGSQTVLPTKMFSRFLLAKFLIFCLIMRSLYQGKLYDIMRKNLYEKEAESINELFENKYHFYTYENLIKRVQEFKFAKR